MENNKLSWLIFLGQARQISASISNNILKRANWSGIQLFGNSEQFNILQSTGRKLLSDAGKISHEKATEKAVLEYRKYKAKNLSEVEKAYLDTIKTVQKKVEKKEQSNKKKDNRKS